MKEIQIFMVILAKGYEWTSSGKDCILKFCLKFISSEYQGESIQETLYFIIFQE